MKPINKAPFEKLAARIQGEQDQEKQERQQAKVGEESHDYMSFDELDGAEAANTRRVGQVASQRKSE